MREIVRKGVKYGGVYRLYESSEEATSFGVDRIVPVREVERDGEWAIADDGWVQRVLSVRSYRKKGRKPTTLVTMPVGRVWLPRRKDFEVGPYLDSGVRTRTAPDWTWGAAEARQRRTEIAVLVYVRYLISGQPVDWAWLGRLWRPDLKYPARRVQQLMRMVRDELRKVFEAHGIDEEAVAKGYAELLLEGSEKTKLAVLDKLAKMLGMDTLDRATRTGPTLPAGVAFTLPSMPDYELSGSTEVELPELKAWEE